VSKQIVLKLDTNDEKEGKTTKNLTITRDCENFVCTDSYLNPHLSIILAEGKSPVLVNHSEIQTLVEHKYIVTNYNKKGKKWKIPKKDNKYLFLQTGDVFSFIVDSLQGIRSIRFEVLSIE
jgi:hypothetical protein